MALGEGLKGFTVGLDSTGELETVDISSNDYTFSSPARMLRVVANAGQTIAMRCHGASEDVSITMGAGVEYVPAIVTTIRRTGTNASEITGVI